MNQEDQASNRASSVAAINLPGDVQATLSALEAAGFPAYVVGGCLRDSLNGDKPGDWDIASAAQPAELAAVFTNSTLIETGLQFGTMTLLTTERAIEITTFRADGDYSDRRHPDQVRYSQDIEDDLARRDFTINAMAYSPIRGLIDPFAGQIDLSKRILRAVGDADRRLTEDALRIMRALRFASTLGFTIEPTLQKALHANCGLLAEISAERIQAELRRLLVGQSILPVLLEYPDVFSVFIPEIGPTIGFDQQSPWHEYDVWEHTARAVAAVNPNDPITRLAALLHDLGKPSTFTIDSSGRGHYNGHAYRGAEIARDRLSALRFDWQTIKQVTELIRLHLDVIQPDNIVRLLRRLREPQLRRLIELKKGDMSAHVGHVVADRLQRLDDCLLALDQALADDACFSLSQLAVNGDDLIVAGIEPGPRLGEMLDSLLDAVIEGLLPNDRIVLLDAINNWQDKE
jgi:tRNA nucleotidyltransferase (CCA-adding enzyme)